MPQLAQRLECCPWRRPPEAAKLRSESTTKRSTDTGARRCSPRLGLRQLSGHEFAAMMDRHGSGGARRLVDFVVAKPTLNLRCGEAAVNRDWVSGSGLPRNEFALCGEGRLERDLHRV